MRRAGTMTKTTELAIRAEAAYDTPAGVWTS